MDIQTLKDTIGRKLKMAREEAQFSQEDVANQLGLSKVGYGAFERGQNLIGLNHLLALAQILDKPVTYFLPPLISNREMNEAQHDPLLRDILDDWPDVSTGLKQAARDLVRHVADHARSRERP